MIECDVVEFRRTSLPPPLIAHLRLDHNLQGSCIGQNLIVEKLHRFYPTNEYTSGVQCQRGHWSIPSSVYYRRV